MTKAIYLNLIFLAASLVAPSAFAMDEGDWFRVDGFGTVGMYGGSDSVAGVRVDSRQNSASTHELLFDGDTQLTLQATVNPHGRLKGVLQMISKKDAESSYKPTVEWAYLQYALMQNVDVKVGRTVAPIFMMSDYRNLFYSQTMARPQTEVYNVNPISYQDGLYAKWDNTIGDGILQLEGFFGKTTVKVAAGDVKLDRVGGLSAKWTQGPFILRAGYSTYQGVSIVAPKITNTINSLINLPANVCSNCSTIIPMIAASSDVSAHVNTVGIAYDQDNWLAQAEWGRRTVSSVVIGSVTGWNAMLGYRHADFTPYVGVGNYKVSQDAIGLVAGPSAPAPFIAQVPYLNASYLGSGDPSRSVVNLGMRWDMRKGVALKTQIDMIRMKNPQVGSNGYVTYPTSMLGTASGFGGKVTMFSINLDFVF